MMIDISQKLAERLQDVAKRRGTSVEKLLGELLSELPPTAEIEVCDHSSAISETEGEEPPSEAQDGYGEFKYPPGTLARCAEVALKAGLASKEQVDTSARSREILNAEFADYVDRRIRG
ncbi:MAG: hypothetical protein OXG39_15855 [Chloroflexi bacterium]|nr:hypothetical protein [Chloroflexota bacterium]